MSKTIEMKVPTIIDGKTRFKKVKIDIRDLRGEIQDGVLVLSGKVRLDQPLRLKEVRFLAPGDEPVGAGTMAILRRFDFGVVTSGNRADAQCVAVFAEAETNREFILARPANLDLSQWVVALCVVAGVKSPLELGGQNVRLHLTDGRVRFIQSCSDSNVWVTIHGQGRSG